MKTLSIEVRIRGTSLAELWRYRELLPFQAWRGVEMHYKRGAIGSAFLVMMLIEDFRTSCFPSRRIEWSVIGISAAVTLIMLASGVTYHVSALYRLSLYATAIGTRVYDALEHVIRLAVENATAYKPDLAFQRNGIVVFPKGGIWKGSSPGETGVWQPV